MKSHEKIHEITIESAYLAAEIPLNRIYPIV
jgi:hypothetical protein